MKTKVRFGTSYEEMKRQVEISLSGMNIYDEEVINGVTSAFRGVDTSAGNGMSDTSSYQMGDYYVKANISTGEFKLYRNMEVE